MLRRMGINIIGKGLQSRYWKYTSGLGDWGIRISGYQGVDIRILGYQVYFEKFLLLPYNLLQYYRIPIVNYIDKLSNIKGQ